MTPLVPSRFLSRSDRATTNEQLYPLEKFATAAWDGAK